jgi:hypothetical protein
LEVELFGSLARAGVRVEQQQAEGVTVCLERAPARLALLCKPCSEERLGTTV